MQGQASRSVPAAKIICPGPTLQAQHVPENKHCSTQPGKGRVRRKRGKGQGGWAQCLFADSSMLSGESGSSSSVGSACGCSTSRPQKNIPGTSMGPADPPCGGGVWGGFVECNGACSTGK